MKTRKMKIGPNKFRAGFDSQSINTSDRTVDVVWTTGFKDLRSNIFGDQYYEELLVDAKAVDLSRLIKNPLLAVHRHDSLNDVHGVIEQAQVKDGLGTAKVRFATDDDSEKIFQKVKDGILCNVSVGYRVNRYKNITKKDDKIPTMLAVAWMPFEISIVPIGFDPGAKFRNQEQENEFEVEIENQQFVEGEDMNENDKAKLLGDEQERIMSIMRSAETGEFTREQVNEFIVRNVPEETVRKMVLQKLEAQTQANRICNAVSTREDNYANRLQGLEEALLHRVDRNNFAVTDKARTFYGQSLVQQVSGVIPRYTGEADATFIKRAMSSSDLPEALANVAEKSLQRQYELLPSTFEPWTRKDILRNYREHSQVKRGDVSSLFERPEGAEFKYGSFSEANEVVRLKDYGKIHAFTSQMIVNDDLGVIQRLASSQAVAASRLDTKMAYLALTTNKVMKDGVVLYHANHGNLGTAGAVGETTVAEAYKMMRKQMSTDNLDNLNLAPKFLVCGPDKEIEARKFLTSIIPNQTSNVNVFQNSMQVIVDGQITGNQFYFVADPMLIDTVTLFRLEGQEQPKISSRVNFNTSSVELKIEYALAAAPMDWRGLFKNAGN